jgi:hypothetical protein
VPSQRPTSQELLHHPWIDPRASKEETVAKYKASLSKTNDEIEEIEERGEGSRKDKRGLKEQKMQEIEAYLHQRTK